MFVKQRSFFSALVTVALTGALSFSGAAGTDPADAAVPCETGWTSTTVNSLPYCQKSAAGASTITFTGIPGLTSVYVEIGGAQGGTGGRNENTYNGVGGQGDVISGDLEIPSGATVSLYGSNAGGNGYQGSGNGICCAFASGGGGGGSALAGYAGGSGGRDGSDGNGHTYGASGGGGGGASVIKVNGAVVAVAAGGGGGGGSDGGGPTNGYANGRAHLSGTNGTYGNAGGVSDPSDGAGGGGGGGGSVGGAGGVGGADSNGQGGAAGLSIAPAGLTTAYAAKTGSGSILVRYLNEIAARVVASAAPSSTGLIAHGQTLSSNQTFGGIPAPTISRAWEIGDSETGPWSNISGQTASTLVLNNPAYIGKYIRENTTASNTTSTGNNSVTQASPVVGPIAISAPGTPDLDSASDSTPAGKSLTSDNITNDMTPTVSVSGLVVGAEVTLIATNGATSKLCKIASAASSTESCTFNTLANPTATPPVASNVLATGTWSLSASQSLNGQSTTSVTPLSNVKIDAVVPTASSVAIVPDLAVNNKVRVTLTFSEALDSIDSTKILIGSTGSWTRSNESLSGSTYAFDVVYATLVNDDINIAVNAGAATDIAGNVQTVGRTFFEQVNTINPSATYTTSSVRLGSSPTSTTLTLNFTRPVWGLTAADFSWPTNGATCSLGTVSPASGPASTYTFDATCTGAGTSTLRLAANAVKDFAAVAGPAAALDLSVIRDTTAPTVTAITSVVVGSRVDYTVTFSEELSQFPASAVSTAVATTTTGTGTWTATTPVRVGSTSQWTFSVSNPDAVNGIYKPSLIVGGNIKDLSGNALTVNPTIADATIVRLPTFAIGTLATPNSAAVALAPNFDLSLYGGKMHGIRITNLDWNTSGSPKDAFVLSPVPAGITVVSNASGIIELSGPNLTEAQWETAIKAIQFDAGTNSGTRRFEFHLRPISGYIYSNEHYLVLSSTTSTLPAALTTASASRYAGMQGYLATITSADEDAWALTTNAAAWISGSDEAVEGTWKHTAGPEIGQTLSPTFWDESPQQPDVAAEDCLISYTSAGYSGWHNVMCNYTQYYITEYGGMSGDPSVPSMKNTASTTVDAVSPDVSSIRSRTANGTYIVGETITLQVNLDEATIVAGGTPRIKLNTSPTARYANYVSGSGTTALTFSYTVQAGDTSADLNYFDTSSLELNGATLKDAAGNNATIGLDALNASSSLASASAIVIDADLFIAPTFTLGTLPSIGPNAVALAPNFSLTTRGAQPFGIRITNENFDASASVLDEFVLSPIPAGVTVVTNAAGVIELTGANLTEAQWEAAVRAIEFDAGNSGATPNMTFHLRPLAAYDYETGHAYIQVADSNKSAADAKIAAATKTFAGFTGYLATPTSATETAVLVASGMTRAGATMHVALEKQAYGSTLVKTLAPASGIGNIAYTNWNAGEPNNPADMAVHIYGDGKWNDYNGNVGVTWGYIVEFGGSAAGSNFLDAMTESATYVSDLVGPAVTNVSAITANGTLVAGDQVQIRVRFDEALTVTGTPRLSLNMGANTRTADCVATTPNTDLLCSYTVVQGDTSSDLSYSSANALSLNGGTISDSATNAATLTLPAIGSAGSLSRNSALVVDGNLNVVTLTAPSATDTDRNLVFTLTSSLPVDYSTLSISDGVDFDFVGIDSITSVVAAGNNQTCTINAVSSVLAGQYGTSALTKAATFSIDDLQNSPVATTALRVTAASIAVEVPAAAGQGVVNRRSVPGTPRTTFTKVAPPAVFQALSDAAKNVLKNNNVISAEPTAPIAEIEGDFSQATARVDAKKKEQILAGEQVAMSIKIDPALAATHEVAAFFKSTVDSNNTGWTFLGRRDFDSSGLAIADPMTFAKRGTYYMRLIVVTKGASFRTASVKRSLVVLPTAPSSTEVVRSQSPLDIFKFRAAALTDSDLPVGVQTLEVAVEVTGTEPTVIDPTPSPTPTPSSSTTGGGSSSPSTPSNPAPTATPSPTITPAPTPTPTVTPAPTPAPSVKPTPKPSASASTAPVVKPKAKPTASPSPTASATATPAPSAPPAPSAAPPVTNAAAAALTPSISIPEINPGEPVANPAIGATGDDSAPPAPFDPLGSPEAIAAVTETAATAVVVAASVAAAAAAAAAAGAAAGASASSAGGSSGGSSSSGSSSGGTPGTEGESDSADIGSLDVVQDDFEIEKSEWGDRLAWFAIPGMQALDRLTHNLSLKLARFSPLFAKLVNDGSYLRAIIGTPILALSIVGGTLGVTGAIANDGAMLTPAWQALLAIAILGIFDAAAGFTAASLFISVSALIATAKGIAIDMGDVRLMFGIMLLSIGPAMLTTAFRTLRKHPANDAKSWWERLTDFAVAPFMAGWSSFAMVSGLPALAGLTLAAANHVQDFALAIAAAALVRVGLEEFAARYYPARLNKINPDHLPEPPMIQMVVSLAIKYAIWILVGGALIGEGWQLWVGSALFLVPTVIGWFQDKFPNYPVIWRILPSGVPGLALSLIIATVTTAATGAIVGAVPALASWSFVILPLPLLALSLLGMFGRHGRDEDELKPAQRNVWIYRVGGVIMLIVTFKLAGVI